MKPSFGWVVPVAIVLNCANALASNLESCASRSFRQLTGLSVVSVRSSGDRAEIVLSSSAYDAVMNSEKSGGEMYDDIVNAVTVAKMCWVERDPSAAGISVDVVSQDGSMIAKDY